MRLASLAFIFLLACEAGAPRPLALVAAPGSKLPAELVGEFSCRSETYRSRLTIRADGRYREVDIFWRRNDRWQPSERAEEPCDPFGRASYIDGELRLDFQPASCEALGDPVSLPMTRRTWRLLEADADGFRSSEVRCRRVP